VSAPDPFDALAHLLGPRARRGQPLGPLTTYGVGGPAALLVEIEGPDDLDPVRAALRHTTLPVCVIGRGSNLLVADAGFDGVVVHLGAGFNWVRLPQGAPSGSAAQAAGEAQAAGRASPPPAVEAGAATPLPVLARQAAEAGWSGLTWAVGVPGSVGGAVRMNAGGHGADMAGCLLRYTWVDLVSEAGGTDPVARLDYGYRHSSIGPTQVVVEAQFAVASGDTAEEQAALGSIVRWRRAHQPGGSNAGSVFANPPGDPAGKLIEEAGLKGFRLGTAHVSEKHANFIQADGGGRADDVRALMELVRSRVLADSGVALSPEVRLLGFEAGETDAMFPSEVGAP
jgi:UDP-N-acetylmuramate dehydrogenase